MKLLTLNTHSLVESEYTKKLKYFVEILAEKKYDVVALQEVNQTLKNDKVSSSELALSGYIPIEEIAITNDNHIYNVVKLLKEKGIDYFWSWVPIKLGYGKYDEGIGILSLKKPEKLKSFYVSKTKDYNDWKSRKVIGARIDGKWYYSVHMSWWNDPDEKFYDQWEVLRKNLNNEATYIMGDFNNPAEIKNEGYTEVLKTGWFDTFEKALKKDGGTTVSGLIDGWKDKKSLTSMRIDFIFKSGDTNTKSSNVIFNRENKEIVSDHFGVEIEE